jgi:hypothetical protein
MAPTAAQPSINFHARIDLDTEQRRRRLQAQTGLSAPRLVGEAFLALERDLRHCKKTPSSTADHQPRASSHPRDKGEATAIRRHDDHEVQT